MHFLVEPSSHEHILTTEIVNAAKQAFPMWNAVKKNDLIADDKSINDTDCHN